MDQPDRIIRLVDLDYAYIDGRSVLSGANLDVAAGERIGLWGANGSGKTTLFHLVMGLLRPASGTIELFGKPRRTESDFGEVRRRIGLLFQDPNDQLFSPTVADDVAFGPLNLGRPRDDVRRLIARSLEQVGLAGYDHRVPYRLSHGEKHRVALASVLAMEPEFLLLDEPAAGLDEKAAERLVGLLDAIGIGYVVASHNRALLDRVTDRVLRMEGGRLAGE